MTAAAPVKKKANTFLKALGDLVILALLLVAAGGGGYFYGVHQQLAPVLKVPPGTPGAMAAAPVSALPPPAQESSTSSSSSGGAAKTQSASESTAEPAPVHSKTKYWLASSGSDYVGYSITVKVNGTPVDNFFGPGKTVNITNLVKSGENTVEYQAKQLGEQYNKHSGEASAVLVLNLVHGPSVTDSFKSSSVLQTFKRNATQTDDATENLHFSVD